ncbi:MAG: M28 family peptidase [Amylibacter sp.]
MSPHSPPVDRQKIRAVFNLDCVGGSSKFGAMTSGIEDLADQVRRAASTSGVAVQVFEPLLQNSDHYNFAIAGIPAMRLNAGSEDADSRLRNVLTEADTRDMVQQEELLAAMNLTRAMIDAAI